MATKTAIPVLGGTGSADLGEGLTSDEFNEHLVWHVVRNEMLWRRQGTHSTKTRGQVRGGGSKPWRQKGTGRARQGTRSAPQWTGGGVVFGPSPRSYGGKVNRKERRAALRCAFGVHTGRGSFAVLADSALDAPSTKTAGKLWRDWQPKGKVTVLCTMEQESVYKSFRNFDDTQVVPVTDVDVADVLWGRSLIVTEAALAHLKTVIGNA